MILERAHVLTLLATAGALGLAPGDTAAQSTPTDSLRIPALMISVGAGGAKDYADWRDGGPVQVVSAQFLVGRHLAVEGEATRCAYADLRFTALAGQARLAATGGVRVVAHSRPAITDVLRRIQRPIQATVAPAEAAGKAVRVSLATGARRHGRFVSLSTSELLLRDSGQDIRYPLDQVLLVETVHQTALKGALLGGGVGVAAGLLVAGALFPTLTLRAVLPMPCRILAPAPARSSAR